MSNPAIPRDQVHSLSEACGNDPLGFQSIAARLMKDQRRLGRFFEENVSALGGKAAQIGLYMMTVCLRVLDQSGGRLYKVSGEDIAAASAKISAVAGGLLPADAGFADRAKAIEWRAQPHLLDEILWALYERSPEQIKDGEADLTPKESALLYLALWTAVEAMDANWKPGKA